MEHELCEILRQQGGGTITISYKPSSEYKAWTICVEPDGGITATQHGRDVDDAADDCADDWYFHQTAADASHPSETAEERNTGLIGESRRCA